MTLLYSIGISFFHFLIRIGAIFGKKARKWVDGRKGLLEKIESDVDK